MAYGQPQQLVTGNVNRVRARALGVCMGGAEKTSISEHVKTVHSSFTVMSKLRMILGCGDFSQRLLASEEPVRFLKYALYTIPDLLIVVP